MKKQKLQRFRNVIVTGFILAGLVLFVVSCGNSKMKNPEIKVNSKAGKIPEPPSIDLHAATFMGDIKAVKQHIQAGSDLNIKEPVMGSTPLITAAVFGKVEVALALIEAGANVNLQNKEGSTALHSAAFLCRREIVKALLENGANKELKNNYGSTAYDAVATPFSEVKAIYDQFSKDLGPLGLKLDYSYLENTRPEIAAMLQ